MTGPVLGAGTDPPNVAVALMRGARRAERLVWLVCALSALSALIGLVARYPFKDGIDMLTLALSLMSASMAMIAVGWARDVRRHAGGYVSRLTQSEARLAGIFRSSMEAIISIDDDQRILLFNPMAETLFGCSAEVAIGRRLDDFIPARYREAHASHVQRFGVTGVSERQMGMQRVLYASRADGSEFPIEASISQITEGDRRLFTVMLRDTTERVRAEAALHRSREELQELSGSILAGREDERRRVARELHDDLGQRLSALKMDLVMLEADLADRELSALGREQIAAMHQVIDGTVACHGSPYRSQLMIGA